MVLSQYKILSNTDLPTLEGMINQLVRDNPGYEMMGSVQASTNASGRLVFFCTFVTDLGNMDSVDRCQGTLDL